MQEKNIFRSNSDFDNSFGLATPFEIDFQANLRQSNPHKGHYTTRHPHYRPR